MAEMTLHGVLLNYFPVSRIPPHRVINPPYIYLPPSHYAFFPRENFIENSWFCFHWNVWYKYLGIILLRWILGLAWYYCYYCFINTLKLHIILSHDLTIYSDRKPTLTLKFWTILLIFDGAGMRGELLRGQIEGRYSSNS